MHDESAELELAPRRVGAIAVDDLVTCAVAAGCGRGRGRGRRVVNVLDGKPAAAWPARWRPRAQPLPGAAEDELAVRAVVRVILVAHKLPLPALLWPLGVNRRRCSRRPRRR